MDGTERARLLRVALEAVAGEQAGAYTVSVAGDDAQLSDSEGYGFRVGHRQVLQRGAVAFLEVAVEFCVDGLCELPPLWGERLPACPLHPGAHPLVVEVGKREVVCRCPDAGVVRTVAY